MNLQRINPKPRIGDQLWAQCCQSWTDARTAYADLDGEAFKAYYCAHHGSELIARNPNNTKPRT